MMKKAVAAIGALVVLAGIALGVVAIQVRAEVAQHAGDLRALTTEVQDVISKVQALRSDLDKSVGEGSAVATSVAELRATVDAANGEIARVDSLLDTAEEVGARVEATSRLAWLVMRNPLIKLASASVATDRRARRLPNRTVTGDPVIPLALEPADDVARARGRASDPARRRSRRAG